MGLSLRSFLILIENIVALISSGVTGLLGVLLISGNSSFDQVPHEAPSLFFTANLVPKLLFMEFNSVFLYSLRIFNPIT